MSASEIDPELLQLDFRTDGTPTEVTFVFAENANEHFTLRSISADSENDDPVDVAVATRNSMISDKLGVEIIANQASDSISGLQAMISAQMAAADEDIDVIAGYQYYDINIATQGWVSNLANMLDENLEPIHYINYDTKDYWGNAYIDAISYKDIVYWVTGDLSMRYIGGVYCTFVNRNLYDQYVEPVYGNLYDTVEQGDWTMEMLCTMANLVYADTNGDQQVDVEDTVGYAWESNDPIDGLAFGCQVPFSTKNTNNNSVTITLNSNRSLSFVTELEKLLYGTHNVYVGYNDSGIIMPMFASGNVGFTVNKLFMAEKYLTDMADDYMIVPLPKLNKE